jgi:cytochrome c-type biogenesis protein CcmE
MTSTLDLTPRDVKVRKKRRWAPIALIVIVMVAIVLLFVNALGNASLFFKNADEAVRDRDHLGTKRFQVQGTVVEGSIHPAEIDGRGAVQFSIVFNGVRADIIHVGDPPDMFNSDVPVVLEGKWVHQAAPTGTDFACGANDGWYIATDRIYAKHDATYTAKKSDRLDEAVKGGTAANQCPSTAARS